MTRYVVERRFERPLEMPVAAIVEANADAGVTWLHSYVTADRLTCFCVYEAPAPEAIRRASAHSGLPVEQIAAVRVLDPQSFDAPRERGDE